MICIHNLNSIIGKHLHCFQAFVEMSFSIGSVQVLASCCQTKQMMGVGEHPGLGGNSVCFVVYLCIGFYEMILNKCMEVMKVEHQLPKMIQNKQLEQV